MKRQKYMKVLANFFLTMRAVFITARPRQWLKNGALFIALMFSGGVDPLSISRVFMGFFAFCLLSSSHYLINDILDISSDQSHPFKKLRPLASKRLSLRIAYIAAIDFALLGLILSIWIGWQFFFIALTFGAFQYLYALIFKRYAIFDAFMITVGYVLRLFAGAIASGVHVPVWLIITSVMMALFLAMGKRRAELTLLETHKGAIPKDVRERRNLYSEKLLNTYMAMFATGTFLSYAFFAYFYQYSASNLGFGDSGYMLLEHLDRKWMMITIPFVLYGIMRYMQLVFENNGEILEKVITADRPLLITAALWALTVLLIIFGLGV